MKDHIQDATLKASPALGGLGATGVLAKLDHIDWAVLAAQLTAAYVVMQMAYLAWKWIREARNKG